MHNAFEREDLEEARAERTSSNEEGGDATKMSNYRFALVSWAKGPDKDTTSILPISWIIDFDPADTDRTYLVECRTTNSKKPTNGWTVEHAVILQLAEKEATLKAAERKLYPDDMPAKRVRKVKRLDFGDEDTSRGDKASSSGNPKPKKAKVAAQRQVEEELLSEDSPLSPSPAESSSQENRDLTRDLQSQIKALHRENTKLRNMVVKEIPALLVDVRGLVSIINTTTNKAVDNRPTKDFDDPDAESDRPGETSLCTPCEPSQVKIGNDGTVTISTHCWERAKACTNANGMARVLLLGLFSVDVLLKSNVKGGVSKLDPSAERRQALDPRKLQALQDAVVNQFPAAKEADIRKSVNSRICELRHQLKCKSL